MSWHFSQVMAEASSEVNSLGGALSAPSSLTPTPAASSWPDKTTDASTPFQSGTTCEPSTDARGLALWMSSLAASRARSFQPNRPSMETASGLKDREAGCGQNTSESLAKYDPATHSLRTAQCLLFEDSTECFATLPRWGMMRSGVLSELTPPATITFANEFGLLPTVMASDWKGGTTAIRKDRGDQRLDQWRDYVKCKYGMTYPHPTHSELRMGWPAGWTDCAASATDKFQAWLNSHGKPSDQL